MIFFSYQLASDGIEYKGPISKETLGKTYYYFYILTLNTVRRISQLNPGFQMLSLFIFCL